MLAVEICSACHHFDDTVETVVGHTTCSDGAGAALQTSGAIVRDRSPAIVDFESFLDPDHLRCADLHWGRHTSRCHTYDRCGPPIVGDTFGEQAGNVPAAIKHWFYPGSSTPKNSSTEILPCTSSAIVVSTSKCQESVNSVQPLH